MLKYKNQHRAWEIKGKSSSALKKVGIRIYSVVYVVALWSILNLYSICYSVTFLMSSRHIFRNHWLCTGLFLSSFDRKGTMGITTFNGPIDNMTNNVQHCIVFDGPLHNHCWEIWVLLKTYLFREVSSANTTNIEDNNWQIWFSKIVTACKMAKSMTNILNTTNIEELQIRFSNMVTFTIILFHNTFIL